VRVLVVEDGNQTAALVEQFGHLSLLASTSEAALAKANTWKPDLLIVDLTRFDGIELAKQLPAKKPLIGLADFMDAKERQAAIEAGYGEFLAKPFKPNELAHALRRIESHGTASKAIAERTRVMAQLTRELNHQPDEGRQPRPK
jgi:DNA-binding response OmpR family regulator